MGGSTPAVCCHADVGHPPCAAARGLGLFMRGFATGEASSSFCLAPRAAKPAGTHAPFCFCPARPQQETLGLRGVRAAAAVVAATAVFFSVLTSDRSCAARLCA